MLKLTSKEKIEHRKYLTRIKNQLYNDYCNNEYSDHNREHINYVIDNILSQLMLQENPAEIEAIHILSNRGIYADYLKPIPILSEGGKLEHLYIADIVVGNTIIEIDGSFHDDMELQVKDFYREENLKNAGYKIKRFSTSEVSKLKEELFN